MSQSVSVWFVLLAAFVAANLPFFTQRLFGVVALPRGKTLPIRLGELLALYLLVGGLGMLLEKRAGQIAPQGWEFYAVTAALFATFAFPGFVWRYLMKHR